MKKLLGLHCLGDWFQYINHIGLWKPPVVNILSPNANQTAEVKKLSPQTTVIGRLYKDDGYYNEQIQNRPIDFARQINEEIKSQHTSNIDYWQSVNEPLPYWDKLPNLNKFTSEWMRLADQSGYKCAILAWSVGNPDLPQHDPMIYWRQFYEALQYAQTNKHVVLVHQYNKPNLINTVEMDDWLIWRIEKKIIPNLAGMGLSKLKFVIGELGIDHMINSGQLGGFQKTPLTDEQYVAQLLVWEKLEQAYANNVIGSCVFTLGSQHPWETYSISTGSNAISLLSTYYASNADKYDDQFEVNLPYIPNNPVDTGNEGTKPMPDLQWDQRLTNRGTKYELYKPQTNEGYYKLIKGEYLNEKEHIFVNVLDKDGKHQYGVPVTVYWGSGSVDIKTEDKSHDQYALADMNFRMDNLGCSYNIRISDKTDKVLCEGLGSDTVHDYKIHRSGRYTFQWVEAGSVTPPVVPPVQTYLPYIPNANTSGNPATVNATVLNVRKEPNTTSDVVAQLKQGDKVFTTEKNGDFYKVGPNAWMHGGWLKFGDSSAPTPPIPPTVPSPVDSKTITIAKFKEYMARILDIDVRVINAVLQIESGNRYYNEFNKPVIRTELHLVKRCLNSPAFDKYFRILGPQPWEGHEYRENENQPWKKFHGGEAGGGQAAEAKVHEIVKNLIRACAFESMSMGAPQILGSNYKMLGYSSAEEMYNDFQNSEAAQITAMFDYISDSGGWQALLNNDFKAFAASYNGPGQADYYAKLLQDYLKTH